MLENPELMSENMILLGDDADQFFNSDLGKYITSRAEQEISANLFKLMDVDPMDTKKVTELQGNIWKARELMKWFDEILKAGRAELATRMANVQEGE